MTITIYTDASSQRNGMGYAWLAVNQIGITIAQGTVRIPSQLNPNYGSTTATARSSNARKHGRAWQLVKNCRYKKIRINHEKD